MRKCPQSKKANFDATHELEELLLEDNPLKARKRNPNLDLSELSADYRVMEQQCARRLALISLRQSLRSADDSYLDLPPHSFLPYDYLRQPRKSWFVLDESGTAASHGVSASGTSDPSTSSSGLGKVHAQAIRIDEQPMADLGMGTNSALSASVGAGGGRATPSARTVRLDAPASPNGGAADGRASPLRRGTPTPSPHPSPQREGQAFEMGERGGVSPPVAGLAQ